MLSNPLLAFDIETIPDPDVGRRSLGFEGGDFAVVRQMFEQRLEEMEGRTGYPQLPHHRVVMICVARLDPGDGSFSLGSVGGEAMEERSHLEGFARLFTGPSQPPRLISWNGNGFDLPVIRYRAMLHGIAMPELYRTDGDWEWNNYQNRFHDMHIDLMDAMSGYGASHWVGLGTISELLGLPGKSFLEEDHVWENLERGRQDLVREYCKLDVVSTMLVYLDWEFHRGNLSEEELRRHVATIRTALQEESFEGWREVTEGLADWPRGSEVLGAGAPASKNGPVDLTSDSRLAAFLSAARACANEMAANARYIDKELPRVTLPEELKDEIRRMCSELVGTGGDVVSDLEDLGSLAEPGDADRTLAQVETVVNRLGQELPSLHSLVTSLQSARATDPELALGCVLVTESATNILQSFSKASDAAETYRESKG